MSELADSISVERDGLRDMLERVAVERETAPEAEHDARYADAAASIRRIAATIDRVDDATLVSIAMISQASNGLASELITARLCAIGFELPLFGSAAEFFAVFDALIEKAYRRRLQ